MIKTDFSLFMKETYHTFKGCRITSEIEMITQEQLRTKGQYQGTNPAAFHIPVFQAQKIS